LVLFVYDCSHPRRRNRHQKSSDGGTYKQWYHTVQIIREVMEPFGR
jgi:hypothetical protein